MRATKARRLKREGLPPDLYASARAKIADAAVERERKATAARAAYRQLEASARQLRERDMGRAIADFEVARARIIVEAEAEAAKR